MKKEYLKFTGFGTCYVRLGDSNVSDVLPKASEGSIEIHWRFV